MALVALSFVKQFGARSQILSGDEIRTYKFDTRGRVWGRGPGANGGEWIRVIRGHAVLAATRLSGLYYSCTWRWLTFDY